MPPLPPGPAPTTDAAAAAAAPHVVPAFGRAVLSRLRTVLAITALVFGTVMVGTLLWPKTYRAVALVALDPQAPRLVTDPASGGGDGSAVVSNAEVATSDGFLIPLAKELKLVDDPEFAGGGSGIGDVLIELRRNLKVGRRGLTYLIDVSFTSRDPDKAARIANAVADEIVRRQQVLRREANTGLSDALRSRLADLRAAVLASEKAVADYRQKNNLLDVAPDGRVGLKRLNSLTDQLGPLRARLEDARARFDKLSKAKADEAADPSIFRSDRLAELLTRLGDERRQMASATQTFGPRHPSVEAAQARIASLESAVRTERGRIVEQAKAEVDVLTEQNAAYEKEIAKRTQEQLETDQKQVVLQDLVRQAQADRQIYEQFLARQKTTQEQGDLSQPDAVVVSSAVPPTRPTRPSASVLGLAGLVCGFGAGLAWVLFGPRPAAPAARPPLAPVEPAAPVVAPPPPVGSSPTVEAAPAVAPSAPADAEAAPPSPPIAEIPDPPSLVPHPEAAATEAPAAPAAVPPAPATVAEIDETPLVATTPEPPPSPAAAPAEPVAAPSPAASERADEPPPEPVAPIEPEVAALAAATVAAIDAPSSPAVDPAAASPPPPDEVPAPPAVAPAEPASPAVEPSPVAAVAPPAVDVGEPVPPAPSPDAAAPRLSPRRHDPAQRLRRMLRTLTARDVPLVADLSRSAPAAYVDGLAAFADTLSAHLDRAPGLVLTVAGETAPTTVAVALLEAIAERGHGVHLHRGGDPAGPSPHHDLVVECVGAPRSLPPIGVHPFTLVAVETSRAGEEALEETLAIWESDPDRVLVAAFLPPPAASGDDVNAS